MAPAPWPVAACDALAGAGKTPPPIRHGGSGPVAPLGSVWPRPLLAPEPAAEGGPVLEPATEVMPPELCFDEQDLARIAAAVAADTARTTHDEALEGLLGRQAAALERLAAGLEDAARTQRNREQSRREQTLALVVAVLRALLATKTQAGGAGLIEAVREMLHHPPEASSARLLVEPEAAAALRAHLPDLAAQAGFVGDLEVVDDTALEAGTVQLRWTDGWSEHVPARIAARIHEALVAHQGLVTIDPCDDRTLAAGVSA